MKRPCCYCIHLTFVLAICLVYLPPSNAAAADPIQIRGTVVDDETDEPITAWMIQAGKFDLETPGRIIWGWSELQSSSKSGRFSTNVRWDEGWTARIVVDGYLPQAIITESPEEGKTELEVTIRLKRGRLIAGRILDHSGEPAKDASVFPVGPGGINVYSGKAMDEHMRRVDPRAKGVATNADGKFELPVGDAKSVVVSSESLNAWAVTIPEVEEGNSDEPLEIKLPEPSKLTINLDIEGCEAESEIFYQMLTSYMKGFERVSSSRTLPIKNRDKLVLEGMTPGKYQFWRKRDIRFESMGMGSSLDRTFIELKPGEQHVINMVRKTGARATGTVTWPDDADVTGVMVSVKSIDPQPDPWSTHEFHKTYDVQQVAGTAELDAVGGNSRNFQTDMLEPGEYELVVHAYVPLTEAQKFRTGIIGPTFHATAKLVIATMGDSEPVELELKPIR